MANTPLRPEIQRIEQDYQRKVAILEARPKLEQALLFVWLLVDIGLIAYFLVSVVLYVISGSFTEARQIATIGENAGSARAVAEMREAEPLLFDDVRVLQHDAGSFDLYTTAENVNAEWYATVTYRFVGGGIEVPTQRVTIMPGETQYLLALAVDAAARPAGAELEVTSVEWARVDRHAVADTQIFLADRSDFEIVDSAYFTDVELEKDTIGRSVVTLTNATAYSYYDPTFIMLLKRAGSIVAINTVQVSKFTAGETREVGVHWFGTIPTTGTVEAIADIDYFDPDSYMGPEGDATGDIRERTLSN